MSLATDSASGVRSTSSIRCHLAAPEDVRSEVTARPGDIGPSGGLIFGPTHHVQLDTPLENFWAMVDTIKETPYSR